MRPPLAFRSQWGAWRAGCIAVPLCTTHPLPELQYVVENCGASAVVVDDAFAAVGKQLEAATGVAALPLPSVSAVGSADWAADSPVRVTPSDGASILYTSGEAPPPRSHRQ